MMKIVLLDKDTLGEVRNLKELNSLGELVEYATTDYDQTLERIAGAEIVITNKVVLDKEILSKVDKLKLICVAATGMNNIDLEYASQKGIAVKNVSGYSTESVAQQTFAMLLSLTNHVHYYHQHVQSGNYSKGKIFTLVDNPIFELKAKTLGIIGMGTIGRRVAEIASVFGMKVIYHSASGVVRNEKYEHIEDKKSFFELADIVSIHSPLTPQTKNFVSAQELAWMKPNAWLINAGRGGIVNEIDLVNSLNNNQIQGAALDVFEKEPLASDSTLLKINNPEKLLLFPHIAWASVEAREELVRGIVRNIREFGV